MPSLCVKWLPVLAALLLSHACLYSPAAGLTVQIYQKKGLAGVGAVHPALDTTVLSRTCTGEGGQPTRVLSAAQQTMLEEAMTNAGADKAYLGARFNGSTRDANWVWMGDNWEPPHYRFAQGYVAPIDEFMYNHWAVSYPQDSEPTTLKSWMLHEVDNDGWCNRAGTALTTYYIACSFDQIEVPTEYPEGPVLQSTTTGSPSNTSPPKSNSNGFPKWAIAVIVVVVVAIVLAVLIPWLVYRYCVEKEEEDAESDFDGDSPRESRSARSSSLRGKASAGENVTAGGMRDDEEVDDDTYSNRSF